jgi:hypothetical protein
VLVNRSCFIYHYMPALMYAEVLTALLVDKLAGAYHHNLAYRTHTQGCSPRRVGRLLCSAAALDGGLLCYLPLQQLPESSTHPPLNLTTRGFLPSFPQAGPICRA